MASMIILKVYLMLLLGHWLHHWLQYSGKGIRISKLERNEEHFHQLGCIPTDNRPCSFHHICSHSIPYFA